MNVWYVFKNSNKDWVGYWLPKSRVQGNTQLEFRDINLMVINVCVDGIQDHGTGWVHLKSEGKS